MSPKDKKCELIGWKSHGLSQLPGCRFGSSQAAAALQPGTLLCHVLRHT